MERTPQAISAGAGGSTATNPARYLVAITSEMVGWMDRRGVWRSDATEVISFSEANDRQEALLLFPAFGWVHGATGNVLLAAGLVTITVRSKSAMRFATTVNHAPRQRNNRTQPGARLADAASDLEQPVHHPHAVVAVHAARLH